MWPRMKKEQAAFLIASMPANCLLSFHQCAFSSSSLELTKTDIPFLHSEEGGARAPIGLLLCRHASGLPIITLHADCLPVRVHPSQTCYAIIRHYRTRSIDIVQVG
jgi:hypothetical protein